MDMDDIRQFLQDNRKEVIVGGISAIIGITILVVNVINYNSGLQVYSISSDELSEEIRTIRSNQPFEITFPLENYQDLRNIGLTIQFDDVNPQSQFRIQLNDESLQDGLSGLESGDEQTFSPDGDLLRSSNTLRIEGTFRVVADASIEGVSVVGYSFSQRVIFLLVNLVGIVILVGPVLAMKYEEFRQRGRFEEQFPEFLRDIVEGARSGMSIPRAIKNTEGNDYGDLDPYVSAMRSKIDWGIPFDTVLQQFADATGSRMIKRAANTIIQSYSSGSNVDDVLDTVGRNIKQVRQLQQERESELYGQVITGYVVFFVFLGVMVGLIKYLVPALSFSGNIPSTGSSLGLLGGAQDFSMTIDQYRPVFRNLIVIQSIFSGLVIGLLSEGELQAGAKHVGILLIAGYSVALLFI